MRRDPLARFPTGPTTHKEDTTMRNDPRPTDDHDDDTPPLVTDDPFTVLDNPDTTEQVASEPDAQTAEDPATDPAPAETDDDAATQDRGPQGARGYDERGNVRPADDRADVLVTDDDTDTEDGA